MGLKYNDQQRREYLNMEDRIGQKWLEIFHEDTEFYSASYWDLFSMAWRYDQPVRKTDALKFMKRVKSAQTAGKFLQNAIQHGFFLEEDNPKDSRSKLLCLSPAMKEGLDEFFDFAVSEVGNANNSICALGPCPPND